MLTQDVIDFIKVKITAGYNPDVLADVLVEKGFDKDEIEEKIEQLSNTAKRAENVERKEYSQDHELAMNYLSNKTKSEQAPRSVFKELEKVSGAKQSFLRMDTFVHLKRVVWNNDVATSGLGAEREAMIISDLNESKGFLHSIQILIHHFNDVTISKPRLKIILLGYMPLFIALIILSALMYDTSLRILAQALIRIALLIPSLVLVPMFIEFLSGKIMNEKAEFSELFKILAIGSVFIIAVEAMLGGIQTLIVAAVIILALFNYLRARFEGGSMKMVLVCLLSGIIAAFVIYLIILLSALCLALVRHAGWSF